MSSHREAPEISQDPVADSTDLYAFVSPDRHDSVTLIANYIPLQAPAGGPNFYEFGDDVLYEIHIDNSGDGRADITYQFRFRTEVAGFPNGRRVFDDVVTIEIRALAGLTYPLIDKKFTPDGAASLVTRWPDPRERAGPVSQSFPVPGRALQRFLQPVLTGRGQRTDGQEDGVK